MKKIYIFLTAVILMICMTTAANANWAEKRVLSLNEKNQDRLLLGEYHLYVFFVQETQFYKFEFENQSIESRLNVGFADEFLNYFIGKMTVSLYDENEKELAKKDIKCGYTGSISMKLEGGKMYYVYIDSTIAGNYSVVAEKLSDMGGDNWKEASEISSYNNISAAIDAPNDEDWYCFKTDSSESFFDFEIENISGGYKEFETYEYMPGTGENPLKSLKKISLYSNNSNKFDFQAKTNTIYYISVKSSSEGGYVIKSQQNIDSLSGDMKNAHRIETEKEYVSSFDGKQDYDWLKFKTSAGKAFYEIVFNRLDDGNYSTVAIYDEDGNKVTESTRLAKSIKI